MRKISVAVVVLLLSSVAQAFEYDPRPEVIQQAINYGVKGKGRDYDSWRREWFKLVGADAASVNFLLQSPFETIAEEALDAARKYETISPDAAEASIASVKNMLRITAMTRGRQSDVDDFVLIAKLGEKVIKPDHVVERGCNDGICAIIVTFDRGNIPDDAKVAFVFVHGGKETTARYDLKKVR